MSTGLVNIQGSVQTSDVQVRQLLEQILAQLTACVELMSAANNLPSIPPDITDKE